MLGQMKEALARKGTELSWNTEVEKLIAEQSFSDKFGARNMRRYIEKNIENKVAEIIIANEKAPARLALVAEDGKVVPYALT